MGFLMHRCTCKNIGLYIDIHARTSVYADKNQEFRLTMDWVFAFFYTTIDSNMATLGD